MNAHVKTTFKVLVPLAVVGAVAWVVAGLVSFDPAAQPVGYVGQPAVSSHALYTGADAASRTRLYAIDYDGMDWSGNLHSYPLSNVGAVEKLPPEGGDDWPNGAAAKIDVQNWDTERKIVTRNASGANVAFRWGNLSAAQQSALLNEEKVLTYIRGDRDNEAPKGKAYRARSTVLGDMIHSTPVYCKAADCGAATVFVGANDGMLHAINAADGSEHFAYIPSVLIPKLKSLTVNPYAHQYFVDGRMDLRKLGGKTILAGALGGGGRGLFALDVTNAVATSEDDAASKILWEITNATTGFEHLGYTYGQPVLATLPSGTDALIVGNGYHNDSNGKASLFLINATTGARIAEIVTPDAGTTSNRNGLSSPTLVDANADGKADYAYAGDLDGNLWKFDLLKNTATKLHTVSPAQSITMAPGILEHPKGGFMVTFVTGRMLVAADATAAATHYAYGIWDAAPVANISLVEQTLTESTYTGATPSIRVRTATAVQPNWDGDGVKHKGWKTALPIGGERVVGDGAFVTGTVFMFLSTNPTIPSPGPPAPSGGNWWMQLNALTGGDNGTIRFDLDGSGTFSADDQVNDTSPVGRDMGGGRRSQLTALDAGSFDVYQANYDKNSGVAKPVDRGVSGGHFDFDIYYSTKTSAVNLPTGTGVTRGTGDPGDPAFCLKTTDVNNELGVLSPTYCSISAPYRFPAKYGFMTGLSTGSACSGTNGFFLQTITCSQYTTDTTDSVLSAFKKQWHTHEYDDKYDVTGVNMLAASDPWLNLSPNVIASATDKTTKFKILVMNQYLNPAAMLAIGAGANEGGVKTYESVKTYQNLASTAEAAKGALLSALPTYTRDDINTFVFNLPLDAFKSKDWWGAGEGPRAGLIPTQTGCVNVGLLGVSNRPGPQGEPKNGALTIQLIKDTTPASAVELNVAGDPRYGWRVKANTPSEPNFTRYVIAEYTAFWHHPNGKCYGDAGWAKNAPQDFQGSGGAQAPVVGSSDPKDGIFGAGGPGGGPTSPTVVKVVKNDDGSTTTTYSDGTVVITYPDGSTKTTLPDGKVVWTIPGVDTGGVVSSVGGIELGGVTTPPEILGRINWRQLGR